LAARLLFPSWGHQRCGVPLSGHPQTKRRLPRVAARHFDLVLQHYPRFRAMAPQIPLGPTSTGVNSRRLTVAALRGRWSPGFLSPFCHHRLRNHRPNGNLLVNPGDRWSRCGLRGPIMNDLHDFTTRFVGGNHKGDSHFPRGGLHRRPHMPINESPEPDCRFPQSCNIRLTRARRRFVSGLRIHMLGSLFWSWV